MLTDDEVFGVAKKIAEARKSFDDQFKLTSSQITSDLTNEEKQTAESISQALIRRPKLTPTAVLTAGAQLLQDQTGSSKAAE